MIPSNWNKVTLENFVHYLEYAEEKPEALLDRIDLIKKRSCAILGCDVETVNNLTGEQQAQIKKLMRVPFPSLLQLNFKHKGQRYRPYIVSKENKNLNKIQVLTQEINKELGIDTEGFNGGKYTAFKNVQKRGTLKYLHHLLFLSCEPVNRFGKTVELTPNQIEKGIEDFKSLPLEVAYPLFIFFLKVSKKWNNLLNDFLKQEMKTMTEELVTTQANLEKDMDGLQ